MQLSTGSNKVEVLLTGKHPADQPHVALANLPGDESRVQYFRNRWGQLLEPGKAEAMNLIGRGETIFGTYLTTELELQEILRAAWGGDVVRFLRGPLSREEALRCLRESITRMKASWKFQKGKMEISPDDLWSTICILFLRDHAAHKTEVCKSGNPNCPSPYFLKRKKNQNLCGQECRRYINAKYALDWWKRIGKKRREQRNKRRKK